MRIYDPRVGRFLSTDPISKDYPELTPYQYASNSPIANIDLDGLERSPAGKVGITAIDATAVQLYPNQLAVIQQQKADAPMVQLRWMVARANNQPVFLSQTYQPRNEYERQRHEMNNAKLYDDHGYNADGSPKPGTKLANNKHFNSFAEKMALPIFGALVADGAGRALFSGVSLLSKGVPKLSDELASTFMGSKYAGVTLKEDMIMYRAGKEGEPLGQFFSSDAPVSVIQTRIDKAILPIWPGGKESSINTVFQIKIPAGTNIYIGEVAPQGGIYLGGTQQIVVPKPWTIKGVEVLKSNPIK